MISCKNAMKIFRYLDQFQNKGIYQVSQRHQISKSLT